MTTEKSQSPLELLKQQCSHILFVLSHPVAGQESSFLEWYRGAHQRAVLDQPGVLGARHYEQHEVDITRGRYPPLPYSYIALYELSLDGAEQAESVIDHIHALHREQSATKEPATWLYYPASEKVGRAAPTGSPLLTLAFANGTPGNEAQFREWYATRHIRHALNVPALVGGQCFERTQFQKSGALEARFSTIAIYEQTGTPEDILASFATIKPGTLNFPTMDKTRFAEAVYRVV